MRAMILSVLLLAGCAKPLPPPAAATAAVPIDGAAHRLDAVQSNQYLHYAVGVHIDATPERVWSVLTDGANIAQWNSTITSFSGDIVQDGALALQSRAGGKRTFKLTVSTFEAPQRMVWEDGSDSFRGVRTFTLTPSEGGTDFAMKEAFTGTMMKMIAPKLPDFSADFEAFAADLKSTAEAPSP